MYDLPTIPKRISILGIPIDAIAQNQAIVCIKHMLSEEGFHHVITPNNEMLVEAENNAAFKAVLLKGDLNIADSTGLIWAAKRQGDLLPQRVTGVDTVTRLCKELHADTPVFLLGAKEGVAEKAASILRSFNPDLVIAGTYAGSPKDEDAEEIIERINKSGAHLLLIAFGAPAQELWIAKYRSELTHVRVAIGIGGTFDFLAGTQIRAPLWMRTVGLEWLWRFLMDPRRLKRMWRAVIVFPWMVLTRSMLKGES